MKLKTKYTLRTIASQLGLKVVFVTYFGDETHGKLLVKEKRILINAHKPRTEHIFTLLHEVGHYVQHVLKPNRKHHPRIFDVRWKLASLAALSSKFRRYFRFIYHKESGKEWEADLWAMCAFILLAKYVGCQDDLRAFIHRHPEKMKLFFLASLGVAWDGLKRRSRKIFGILQMPFGTP